MSNTIVSFMLLDQPATPDMRAVAHALRARHPELATEATDDGHRQSLRTDAPLIRCAGKLVAVMPMPAPIPHDSGLWARAETWWPESKDVVPRHRGHLIVSMLGKDEPPLVAARITTAVIGALIATMPQCCGVVWGAQVARSSRLWLKRSNDAFAPFPDFPFSLWVDIDPFRSGDEVGAMTVGLSKFVGREIEFVTGKLKPADLVERIAGLAAYLIEHGNVVKDGDTIGPDENDRILVRYKNSAFFENLPVFCCTDDFKR